MKKKLLALLILALPLPAFAAITVADPVQGSGGNPPANVTATQVCAAGDVALVGITLISPGATLTSVQNTVNSGAFTLVGSPFNDPTNGTWIQWAYRVCTSSDGTPVISATWSVTQYGYLNYQRITGFTGTPTIDAAMTQDFSASSTTSFSFSAGNTVAANEAVFFAIAAAPGLAATPSGWTAEAGGGNRGTYVQIPPSSGTAISASETLSSGYWDVQTFGIYDATASGPSKSQFFFGELLPSEPILVNLPIPSHESSPSG